MPDHAPCPTCGKPLPPDSPAASCPACLLAAGLDGDRTLDAAATAAAPSPAELARHFPDLEIIELIGQGGMGLVYKARQLRLDRLVALKILAPDVAAKPGFAERFLREARALAQLSHPNIVGVYDFGESEGLYYFVMEFVDGLNLRQAQRERRLTPQQALAIVPRICDALQFAHDHGVVHRDIKPENVLMNQRGEIKIADFGLAKLVRRRDNATLTLGDQVMGTPAYMAPEQIEQPDTVDHRADIYSLGVVFYEMLTGELPLGRFAPPSQKAEIDVRLDEVVLRTLEKERELRYQRVDEVKTEIDDLGTAASDTGSTDATTKLVGDVVRAAGRALESAFGPLSVTVIESGASAEKSAGAGSGDAVDEAVRAVTDALRSAEESPPRVPRDEQRFSRLVISGAVLTFAGLLSAVPMLLLLSRAGLDVNTPDTTWAISIPFMIAGAVLKLATLAGLILSISGWVAVVRSKGRLRGLWLAVVATIVSLFALFGGSPLLLPDRMMF